jgi:hypothetical protein
MPMHATHRKHELHWCPYPWQKRRPVAEHLDYLGVMLHSAQEWIKPSHVLLRAASAKLALNPHRLISDIIELGAVK